ncbi:MAG: O-antigen ligase family protein, partial [Candidatus Omnitrophica bacterium]|nr:O-antigen ligase family protein [Candidatus Omnitrophota bacterium]
MFTAFSTVLDSFIQYYITGKDIFLGHAIELRSRASAGFRTPNGLGGYLTIFLPGLLAWVLLANQKYRYRLGTSLILVLSMWSLVITFSRGAWIGIFFGGMFLMLCVLLPKKRLHIYFSLGLLWATVILLITFILILANSSEQELFSRCQTINWRLNLWSECIDMIKDKLLFGHGINTFMIIFQAYRQNSFMGPTYAHNCYIQLAAETG